MRVKFCHFPQSIASTNSNKQQRSHRDVTTTGEQRHRSERLAGLLRPAAAIPGRVPARYRRRISPPAVPVLRATGSRLPRDHQPPGLPAGKERKHAR